MKSSYSGYGFILLIIALALQDCKREEFSFNPPDKIVGNLTFAGKTIFLDSEELAVLETVTDDKLVFSGTPGALSDIDTKYHQGFILVLGVSEKTPFGLMRKIESIQQDGSYLTFFTSDCTITDAIKDGEIHFVSKLVRNNIDTVFGKKSEAFPANGKSFEGPVTSFNHKVIYNSSGKTVWIDGVSGIVPELNVTIRIKSSEVSKISIIARLTKIDELVVSSNGAFNSENEIDAAQYVSKAPIIVDKIVFSPSLNIKTGLKGTVSGAFSQGVRQDREITINSLFENSVWNSPVITQTVSSDYSSPEISSNSDITAFVDPVYDIMLFGKPFYSLSSKAYLQLTSDTGWSEWWKLYIGVTGSATIKSSVLDSMDDHSESIVVNRAEISRASGPFGTKR